MADSDVADIEDFERWKVDSLKNYLKKRGIGVDGSKKTLVARAFAAWEWKLPLVPTQEEYEAQVKAGGGEY